MKNFEIPEEKKLPNLSSFDTIKEIASGGFGRVYEGQDQITKLKVAIKKSFAGNKLSADNLITEVKTLSNISHPSIQLLIGYYYDEQNDEHNMITPLYEKKSLADMIFKNKDDKLGDSGKFNIIYGIASAMKYLHKNDISHRDLKPGNILLDNHYYPILIDFGISRRNIEEMKTKIGSDNYLAPEIYTEDVYNEKVDVYSFGLIILEMYTKKLTFKNIPWGKMLEKKTEFKIDISNKMPPFLRKIVKMCLDPNPLKRPDFGKIISKLVKNSIRFVNSTNSNKYMKYITITKKQKYFFRMPKQIFKPPEPNWNGDINELINWTIIDQVLESSKDKKIILIMLFGPFGLGKSTYLKHLTGNQAFMCGNNEKKTTIGIYIDGKYTVDEIKNQVSDEIAPEFYELFDSLKLDDSYHIYFLDSQGIGDDTYDKQKEILDKINSIFCSSSSVCISIQNTNEPNNTSMKSVFKISRSIQFSSLTKQFFLVRNYDDFNSLPDLSFEQLNEFQLKNIESLKRERKSIIELYDVNNIMLLGFGDMTNMDIFYISIWFSFYTILSSLNNEIIYTSSEIKNNLKSKTNIFFGEEYNQYEQFIKHPPTELENILPNSKEDINKVCILSFYWSLDKIINYLYPSKQYNLDQKNEHVIVFIENIFKLFFPYKLSQIECSYIDFIQSIKEITDDLISSTNCEIQNVIFKERFTPSNFALASGSMLITSACSEIGKISLTSGTLLIISLLIQSVINRKITIKDILNKYHYSNYPLIWDKNIKSITMDNLPFSKRILIMNNEIDPNELNDSKNNESDDSNNDVNFSSYDELLDGFLLRDIYEKKTCNKQIPKKIIKVGQFLSSILENYQLIVYFEQNMNNDSSLFFKALSGIDFNLTNNKQIKISSKSISIDTLMDRFKRNNDKPCSTIKNVKIKFIYMKGYGINEINELYDYLEIKPIFVSSLKDDNNGIQIIPYATSKFYLFYLSQNFYQSIANDLYNRSHKWDYFVVNEKSFIDIVNNDQVDQLKQNLGIPFANIIPINSNSFYINDYESIAQALIKYGCLSILQGQFSNKT